MKKGPCDKKKLIAINRIFDLCLIGVVLGFVLGKKAFEAAVPFLLPVLTVLAGILSYVHWKLPPEDKIHAKISVSSFGIHPYVTFFALLLYTFFYFAA